MVKPRRRGRFIVLEGIDGSGTTTQVAYLVSWLLERGELVHGTRQPSTGPVGSLLRQVLSGRVVGRGAEGKPAPVDPTAVALLFAADRIDHVASEITPHLEAGRHVICDRYVLSSLAYQSLDTDLAFVRAINGKAPAPDLTIFLRVKPEVAMDRIAATRSDRDAFENLPFQRRVAKAYDSLLEKYRDGRVVELDGEEVPGTVRGRVRAAVEDLL
ncbi:MAG: dTMP kinase [Deltaproteobacteria bacterium]|nr:dTMP kinase [Deltaproteobacteria bacterium]